MAASDASGPVDPEVPGTAPTAEVTPEPVVKAAAKRPAAAAPRLVNSRPVPLPCMKAPKTMKTAMVVATMPVSGP